MSEQKGDYGIVSYILGIASIVFAFVSPLAGLAFGIIGLVHGRKSKNPSAGRGKKLSTIGIIISAIMLIVVTVIAVYTGLTELNSLNLPNY